MNLKASVSFFLSKEECIPRFFHKINTPLFSLRKMPYQSHADILLHPIERKTSLDHNFIFSHIHFSLIPFSDDENKLLDLHVSSRENETSPVAFTPLHNFHPSHNSSPSPHLHHSHPNHHDNGMSQNNGGEDLFDHGAQGTTLHNLQSNSYFHPQEASALR